MFFNYDVDKMQKELQILGYHMNYVKWKHLFSPVQKFSTC